MKTNCKLLTYVVIGLGLLGSHYRAIATGGGSQTNEVCTGPTLGQNSISASSFTFSVSGGSSGTWVVFAASEINDGWDIVGALTLNGGSTTFTDSTIAGVAHRYYKLGNGTCCSRAIGFMRLSAPPGLTDVADQLDNGAGNTLTSLFNPMPSGVSLPNGTEVLKWQSSGWGFDVYTMTSGSWSPNGSATMQPGDPARIHNYTSNSLALTFVGLVPEGTSLTHPLAPFPGSNHLSFVSSVIPKTGRITADLGYHPGPDGDVLMTFDASTQQWGPTTYYYITDTGDPAYPDGWYEDQNWTLSEPVLGVGQACWLQLWHSNSWTQNFTVCPNPNL